MLATPPPLKLLPPVSKEWQWPTLARSVRRSLRVVKGFGSGCGAVLNKHLAAYNPPWSSIRQRKTCCFYGGKKSASVQMLVYLGFTSDEDPVILAKLFRKPSRTSSCRTGVNNRIYFTRKVGKTSALKHLIAGCKVQG